MKKPYYEFVAFDAAVNLLRPRCKWEMNHGQFVWKDPRPCPSLEEIQNLIARIKDFEESVDYILLPEDIEEESDPAQDDVTQGISNYHPDQQNLDGGDNIGGEAGKSGVPPEPFRP